MKTVASVLERPAVRGLGATLVFAGLTAAFAQVRIVLPFTPVPFTLQTLAVVLSGLLLGSRLGALAQLEYLVAGLAGAPVFAGWTGGPAALVGPSGGYLPGFVLGAFITGMVFERCGRPDKFRAFGAGMAGIAGVYVCGGAWLSVWLALAGSPSPGLSAWLLGVMPFVGIDAVKVTFAAMVAGDFSRWKR